MKTLENYFTRPTSGEATPQKKQKTDKHNLITPEVSHFSAAVTSSSLICKSISQVEPITSTLDRSTYWRNPRKLRPRKRREQLYLDFGQTSFGSRTLCPICNTLYVHGVEEDELNHVRICNDYKLGVSFRFEKNVRVTCHDRIQSQEIHGEIYKSSFVVEVRPSDGLRLRRKVLEVKQIVDKELGFVPIGGSEDGDDHNFKSLEKKTAFLYVSQKRVIGFCTVELILQAFRFKSGAKSSVSDNSTGDLTRHRSLEPSPATMGVHQIWCHGAHRKKGVAKKLLDTARSKVVYGSTIEIEEVAFSSPTGDGLAFAKKYTGIIEPLIYDC